MIRFFFRLVDFLLAPFFVLRLFVWVGLTYIDSNYLKRRRKGEKVRMLNDI